MRQENLEERQSSFLGALVNSGRELCFLHIIPNYKEVLRLNRRYIFFKY